MKIVIAIDSFKGCLTSNEANRAAAEGIRSICPDAEIVVMGTGTLTQYRGQVPVPMTRFSKYI